MSQALAVAGPLVSATGTILGARSEAKALKKEAQQLEIQAGTERAISQRSAMEERRQARLAASRGLAVAAAAMSWEVATSPANQVRTPMHANTPTVRPATGRPA